MSAYKFDTQELVAALGDVRDGDQLILTLTGETLERMPIAGTDCVVILAEGGNECPDPLVVNGGFESPIVADAWDVFSSGTPGLGWVVEWVEPYPGAPARARLELQRGILGGAYEGEQHAELDSDWAGPQGEFGHPASVRIYQDICTSQDMTYELSYAWKPRPGLDSQVEVYWDGILLNSHSGSEGDWQVETIDLLEAAGPSAKTTRLAFVETGVADSWGMFLDDVSVTAVPVESEKNKGKQK